jgi:hypothetical protein
MRVPPRSIRSNLAALVLLAVTLLAPSGWSHGGDTSYVVLTPNGRTIDCVLNLDLIDTERALRVSRTELGEGRRREVVADYLVTHLSLSDGTRPCPIEPAPESMRLDLETARLFLSFKAYCSRTPERLDVKFTILFDYMGPSYLGIVRLEGGSNATLMFTKAQPSGTLAIGPSFDPPPPPPIDPHLVSTAPTGSSTPPTGDASQPTSATSRWSWRGLTAAIRIGIAHIWSGADHMLFLLALLMTSVLERTDSGWVPRGHLRPALVDVAKIVTGFTLTHSITLSLAALGLLRPAARLIEPAIAASVAIAALDNLRPLLGGRKWLIASTLGLLHGFGFASALNELALPQEALIVVLVGFAMGVETGQAIFVLGFVPVAFTLRKTRFYQRWIVHGGSLVIALLALVWMVERAAPRR